MREKEEKDEKTCKKMIKSEKLFDILSRISIKL